ncbi:hypothetical protein ACFQZX_10025 [Mucilaginibacter litoreus]|uniref:Uncharacterized protein n=1 Tax=Mucilaginibacter litoreus TaxID=1048221 RepID=A0ABW3ASM6_9SPHI
MLIISVPSSTSLTNAFDQFDLPRPLSGTDTEGTDTMVLLFEDEEEAIEYLDALEDYSTGLDDDAIQKPYINALVSAISNDDFVQGYLR